MSAVSLATTCDSNGSENTFEPVIIAQSPGMKKALHLARRVAATDLPVLLAGETGTGKEVLAQAIHRWSGRRGELIDVDCGALPPGMVVAELFGHRKGAYTTAVDSMPGLVERAHRGTLFLDELGNLSAEGQGALLRMLETGEVRRVGDRVKVEVSVRMVAATQNAPGCLPGHHQMRPELYHRLAGTVITLPPLRHRPEDLLPMARHFAALMNRRVGQPVQRLLELHPWPGNVRELRHVIGRAVFLTDAEELDAGTVGEALEIGSETLAQWNGTERLLSSVRASLVALYQDCCGDIEAMAVSLA